MINKIGWSLYAWLPNNLEILLTVSCYHLNSKGESKFLTKLILLPVNSSAVKETFSSCSWYPYGSQLPCDFTEGAISQIVFCSSRRSQAAYSVNHSSIESIICPSSIFSIQPAIHTGKWCLYWSKIVLCYFIAEQVMHPFNRAHSSFNKVLLLEFIIQLITLYSGFS